MLDEFKAGKQQEEVFPKIIGRSLSQFNTEFLAWADQQIATWGYDEATTKKYDELRERGEELIKVRQYVEAVAVWEEIAKIRPVDALPHQRLAGLYLTKEINDREKAVEHLKVLHQVELKDNRYAKRIARVYRDGGKPAEGVRYALDAVYIDPYDLDAHTLLAELYEKTGDSEGLKREQKVIPVLKAWVEKNRK
jgi:tetratricopeptide (TPR) repeat protein